MPFDFTPTQYAHLASMLLAGGMLVLALMAQLWRQLARRLRLAQVIWLAGLALTGLLAWEVITATENLVDGAWRSAICAGGTILGVVLAGILTRLVWLNAGRQWLADWLVTGLAGGVFALALAGATTDNIPTLDESEFASPAMLLGGINHPLSEQKAYTDRGRVIPLYTAEDQPPLPERRLPDPGVYWPEHAFGSQLIRTAPPDPNYNCHGWVFTGGQFILAPDAVEMILHDNGYYPVERPRVGDIVVYYDQGGMITHTALVRAIGEEDFVLVESKWGCKGGRYLHLPELWFSARLVYYRTDRGSHVIRGLEKPTAASPLVGKLPHGKSASVVLPGIPSK
jgi:hypothetical protein